MKLKYYLLALILGTTTATTKAQDYDFGLFGGASFYSGDLYPGFSNGVGNAFKGFRPAIGGIARYNFHPNFSVRGNLNFGYVAYYDKYGNKGTSLEKRNLSFHSPIVEVSAMLEVNFMKYIAGTRKYKFAPYGFVGFGLTYMNPKTWLDGERYTLRKYDTELEKINSTYSVIQPVIPIGLGLKYNYKRDWTIGAEFGWRKMFTDYLDDVSGSYTGGTSGSLDDRLSNRSGSDVSVGAQRGNPEYKDAYFFVGFTLTKTIRPYSCR